MTDAIATGRLERRYRRLLRCYPAGYRARYDEEMIAVLMSASDPQQRRPDPGEAYHLIVSGLRARLNASLRGERTPAWRAAFVLFAYLAAAAITAINLHTVIAPQFSGFVERPGPILNLHIAPYTSHGGEAMAAGWALVAIAVAVRRIRVAAIGAAIGVIGQLAVMAVQFGNEPDSVVGSWWRLVLAVSAASALLALYREPGGTPAIGRRTRIAVAVTVLLGAAWPAFESWNTVWTPLGNDMWMAHQRILLPFFPLTGVLMIVVIAVIVLRLAPAVRRRVLLLCAPAVATLAMVGWTFGGYLASSPRFDPPVYPVVPQWIALVAVPLLVWTAGLGLLRRHERKLASGELLA